jgi:hypothetical protein
MRRLARDFKPRRVVAGLGLAVVVAVVAAGCSSTSTSTTTTTATTKTTVTTAAPKTSTTVTTVAPSSTTTTPSTGLSGSSLLSKFKSGEQATFIATYKITSGSSKSLTSLTIAEEPPDSLFGGTTASGTFKLITLGTKSYICSGGAGGTGATCFSEGAEASLADLFALYQPNYYLPYFQAAAKAAGAQVSYSSKSVNGFSLSCVSVTGATNEKGTGTFCVTGQGVLGYVSWTGATAASAGSFEITSFSTTVPSDEFTLPATPTTIP